MPHLYLSPYLDGYLLVVPSPEVDRAKAALAEQVTQRDILEGAAAAGAGRLGAQHAVRAAQGCRGAAMAALEPCGAVVEDAGRSLRRLPVSERGAETLTRRHRER